MKDLFIVGAGGFGKEVLWQAKRMNKENLEWNIKGFIDDDESLVGTKQDDLEVVGNCDYLKTLENDVYVVVALGSVRARHIVVDKIKQFPHIHFANIIDPSVIMSDRVKIGEGCIICAGTVISVDINIKDHVIINLDCTIGHDVVIDNYVTIYPSVNVSGNVVIGEKTELGTGAQVIQGKNIGNCSIVGAGSVVVKDIPDNCTAVGIPAKPIKFH